MTKKRLNITKLLIALMLATIPSVYSAQQEEEVVNGHNDQIDISSLTAAMGKMALKNYRYEDCDVNI